MKLKTIQIFLQQKNKPRQKNLARPYYIRFYGKPLSWKRLF